MADFRNPIRAPRRARGGLPYHSTASTTTSTDPLDDRNFWRAVVLKLGTMPMPCPFAVKELAAAKGVSPERAFAKFWTHYCHDAPSGLQ